MMSSDSIAPIATRGIEPSYSPREAAVLLGRSYSWLDQRLHAGQFVRPDGTFVQPLRTARRLPAIHSGDARRHSAQQLPKPLVPDGPFEVHLPRAARSRPPRDRRVQDPKLSVFLWAARGGGQRSLAATQNGIAGSGWGPQPGAENHQAGARTLYRRGEPIGTSDWRRVCPKTFVSEMVDADGRVPGR